MAKRNHRPQKSEQEHPDADERPVVVRPHPHLDDPMRNPKQLEPDEAAMRNGVEHGGDMSNAEYLETRGTGGRKRLQNGPWSNKGHAGADHSKPRR
jgi:hypothetical protein